MGRARTFATDTPATATGTSVLVVSRRALEVLAAAVLLVLALPLMAVLALAVRLGSHGPVLHREHGHDRAGRPVVRLSFRTTLDGAGTPHHARVRAVVGAGDAAVLTGVGRFMRRTRTERLPALVQVVRGELPLR